MDPLQIDVSIAPCHVNTLPLLSCPHLHLCSPRQHAAIFQSWQARGLVKSNNRFVISLAVLLSAFSLTRPPPSTSFLQNMASPSPHIHLSSTLANNILPGSGIMLDTRPGARSKVSSAGTTPGSPKRSGGEPTLAIASPHDDPLTRPRIAAIRNNTCIWAWFTATSLSHHKWRRWRWRRWPAA